MSLPLCEAALRMQARRLDVRSRPRQALAAACVAVWLGAPMLAWMVASEVGASLGPAFEQTGAARALALGLCLASAAMGAVAAVALPKPYAFGAQVSVAPLPVRSRVVASLVPPVAAAAIVVAPAITAGLAGLLASSPTGALAVAPMLGALACAACGGALGVEAVLRCVRRIVSPVVALAAVSAVALFGLAVECAARSVVAATGVGRGTVAVVVVVASAAAAAWWPTLVVTRPSARPRGSRAPRMVVPSRPAPALAATALAVLWRARDLRASLIAAACFGLLGLLAGAGTGAPAAAGVLLGGGSCAVASCFVPLSVRGRLDPGGWVWRLAGRTLVGAAWAVASLALVLAALVPVGVVAGWNGAQATTACAQVAALAVLAWSCALAAGALVPRRAGGPGDDAYSLALFAAAALLVGGGISLAGTWLDARGVPGAITATVSITGSAAAATALLAGLWGRR